MQRGLAFQNRLRAVELAPARAACPHRLADVFETHGIHADRFRNWILDRSSACVAASDRCPDCSIRCGQQLAFEYVLAHIHQQRVDIGLPPSRQRDDVLRTDAR